MSRQDNRYRIVAPRMMVVVSVEVFNRHLAHPGLMQTDRKTLRQRSGWYSHWDRATKTLYLARRADRDGSSWRVTEQGLLLQQPILSERRIARNRALHGDDWRTWPEYKAFAEDGDRSHLKEHYNEGRDN